MTVFGRNKGRGNGGRDGLADGVCVVAPSTIVTVTVEAADGDGDEVHFHAGGQGFWIARLLGHLGVPTVLCTVLGGETGRVAAALLDDEPFDVRAVTTTDPSGSWVHDRRSGERVPVGEAPGRPLSRHDTDELFGAALVASLNAGICVLAGPHRPNLVGAAHYRRLCQDLAANDVSVIADLSGDHLLAALEPGIDFCKVSDDDLAKTDGLGPGDPVEALEQLHRSGARNVAITRGADPLIAFVDGSPVEVHVPALHPVDPRGSGDAFTALVAATHHWGLTWTEAAQWGASAGALTAVRRGLATADPQEIHQLLDRVDVRSLR